MIGLPHGMPREQCSGQGGGHGLTDALLFKRSQECVVIWNFLLFKKYSVEQ